MATNQLENIKVAVRLRPFTEKEKQKNNKRIVDIEQNTVVLYSPRNKNDVHLKRFTFDYSYWSHDGFRRDPFGVNIPDSTHPNYAKYVGQERVFEDLGQFLLFNALQGYNSALLAYGQTGSGKSYTVSGYGQNEGILPRFARALFEELEKKTNNTVSNVNDNQITTTTTVDDATSTKPKEDQLEKEGEPESKGAASSNSNNNRYEVYFSMIEIYNEVVRDLLAKSHGDLLNQSTRRGLKVREHPKHGFFVEHLTSIKCADKEEIEQRIEEGQLNKSIAATSMNETSSRGHTIYEFKIKQYKTNTNTTTTSTTPEGPSTETLLTTSVVQLVDLAGSERAAVHVLQQQQHQQAFGTIGNDFHRSASTRSPTPKSTANQQENSNTLASNTLTKQSNNRLTNGDKIPTSASSSSSANTIGTFSVRKMNVHNNISLNVNTQQRFKESVSINQSLSALGNCIQVMSQYSQQLELANQQQTIRRPKIPYRDSVLTKLLNRCCLSGNSKVVIIATLSPADVNYDDTLSTLRFADRAKQIRTHAIINRMSRSEIAAVDSLQKENERLKQIVDGRVTRSDDSSQTSNFDENENIMENFTGSKIPQSSSGNSSKKGGGKSTLTSQTSGDRFIESVATPIRSRTTIRKSSNSKESSVQPARVRHKQHHHLSSASSNPSIAILNNSKTGAGVLLTNKHRRQMDKLVSPTDPNKSVTKSKSMAYGLSNTTAGNEDDDVNLELARLHNKEEDLDNEDGSYIVDDDVKEGLLSPDSDDSFAALADEDLTNEEKISIFNRLLSNSTVNNKQFQQQSNNNQDLVVQDNDQNNNSSDGKKKLSRPKRSSKIRAGIREVAILSSSLKKSNPYLSNLNPDEQLSGMISYIIKQGETIIGKSNDCDIMLHGPELRGRHAKITRETSSNGQSAVYIEPIFDTNVPTGKEEEEELEKGKEQQQQQNDKDEEKNVALMVNGTPVKEKIKLNHCDRLLFGTNAYFVFSDYFKEGTANEKNGNSTLADLDLVTFDMARAEVLKRVMAEAKNEAMIKEIKDYTHRPGTGKQIHRSPTHNKSLTNNSFKEKSKENSKSFQGNNKLNRLIKTIQDDLPDSMNGNDDKNQREPTVTKKDNEENFGSNEQEEENEAINRYRDQLMEDTYEYTLPIFEINAVAKDMDIKVTYGLKILTGEEQLPQDQANSTYIDSNASEVSSSASGDAEMADGVTTLAPNNGAKQAGATNDNKKSSTLDNDRVTHLTKLDDLDIPPALYIKVHLEELDMDFYWSKEKFHLRRDKILELYGAWDVGGKSGLVEHLIEQSKTSMMMKTINGNSNYLFDPFIDDPNTTFVLIGNAQITLQPLSHLSDIKDDYDILDVDDNIVGNVSLEVIPCYDELLASSEVNNSSQPEEHSNDRDVDNQLYKPFGEEDLKKNFLENPRDLLGKRLIFMLKIKSCRNISDRYLNIFCQYTLKPQTSLVRTKLLRSDNPNNNPIFNENEANSASGEQQQDSSSPAANNTNSGEDELVFNHSHYIIIDKVNEDILNFLDLGFLTIQVVGQYKYNQSYPFSSTSSSSAINKSPTVVSTIINSINRYKYNMEKQHRNVNGSPSGSGNYGNLIGYYNSDSAKSNRGAINSNSGASSVVSTSATVNLYDQQNEDEEGIGSINGLSQDNVIDMILTKRKLDRAENQLHYLKRTVNIAEHYNKKHIPVKTVKKLLNSYGKELDSGSLEEMTANVTVKGKSTNKHSGCIVQ